MASLAFLIFLPWMDFVMISCLFCFAYHMYAAIVWTFVGLCVAISLVFMAVNMGRNTGTKGGRPPMYYLFLGVLCLCACICATCVGFYNYDASMSDFWAYEETRVYTNVLPSKPAKGFTDAGIIMFSSNAKVDLTKAVGYRSGTMYCVAPILGTQPAKAVEYWAVGTDCCAQRGSFNCDDVKNPDAHGGYVVLDASPLSPKAYPLYNKAAKEAAAAYNLVAAEEPLFIRWVVDPTKGENDAWHSAVSFLVGSIFVYLFVSIVSAFILHYGSPGRRR